MSEMVERVARAAYFAGEGISDAFNPIHDSHWAHWWVVDREVHEAMARAAIEAMREPTEAMVEAGDQAMTSELLVPGDCEYPWINMLSEALK
jgi:hypothetical protein